MENNEQPFELLNVKTIWHTERFIAELEEASRRHPLPYNQFPQVIELNGQIANSTNQLLRDTMKDPEKRERAMHAKIGIDGKLLMCSEVNVGTRDSVEIQSVMYGEDLSPDEMKYSRREYLAFTMHTHGDVDVPASFADMTMLLKDFSNGELASFVLTPTTKMIFIRSLETPELDTDKAKELTIEKGDELTKELMPHTLDEMNVQADMIAQINKKMQKIFDFCREHKIVIYSSLEGDRYTKLNI